MNQSPRQMMKTKFPMRVTTVTALLAAVAFAWVGQTGSSAQNAPEPERLRQHVTYLASEALEGRRTGTPGADKAAEYIAGQFARLGLLYPSQTATAANSKTLSLKGFFQPFPSVAAMELGSRNRFAFSRVKQFGSEMTAKAYTLNFGSDWIPLPVSSSDRLENLPAVFVSFGLNVSELNYNDYADKQVSGKVAVARTGSPDGDNPHGRFFRYEDVRWKAIAARNAGAKALVIISKQESVKNDRLLKLRYDNTSGDAGLPVVLISSKAAARLFSETPDSPSDSWEQRLVTDNQSTSRGLSNYLTLETNLVRREAGAMNVIGILEGSDPHLKSEALVIGAHYDHLGRGGAGSLAHKRDEIHYGADDNASGVAGLLELARIFSGQGARPARTIVFIAFSGEEEGLLGSKYYGNQPIVPLADTVAMINLDMIGRSKANRLIIGGVGTAQEWKDKIEEAQQWIATPSSLVAGAGRNLPLSGFLTRPFELTLTEDGFGPSDHASFYAKQIPVLFFWTGTHEDYHKPSDTADKINYTDQARIVSLVARIVSQAVKGKRLTYTSAKSESTSRAMGFRVYLGTIPSYADSENGLVLDGVRDESPAAQAGLKPGDRIVKLAGREVRNVYDYTYALGEMKADQEYEVEIVRGNERLKLRITPVARK